MAEIPLSLFQVIFPRIKDIVVEHLSFHDEPGGAGRYSGGKGVRIDYRVRSGGRVRELKREKILVIPQFAVGRNVLSPSQLSEGTFKTITLLFYVMTERSSALLIEEPEVCVHHDLLLLGVRLD